MSQEPETNAVTPAAPTPEAGDPAAAPAAPSTPTAATPDAAATAPAAKRPQPAYGEYAPEGWSWTPPEEAAPNPAAPAAAAAAARPNSAPGAGAGTVPGVPHNLGARAGSGTSPAAVSVAPPQTSSQPTAQPTSQAGAPDSAPVADGHYRAAAPAGAPAPKGRGVADRVISILLLVVGAFGALNMAVTMITLPDTFNLMANAAQIEGFTIPEALRTLSTVGAISVLAVFAVNLILTIQRLRAGKLAFWVPLVACVCAVLIMFVVMFIGVTMTPDLIAFASDPDAMNKLLESLTTQ